MIASVKPPAIQRCTDHTGYREKPAYYSRAAARRHAMPGMRVYRCPFDSNLVPHYHLTRRPA